MGFLTAFENFVDGIGNTKAKAKAMSEYRIVPQTFVIVIPKGENPHDFVKRDYPELCEMGYSVEDLNQGGSQ